MPTPLSAGDGNFWGLDSSGDVVLYKSGQPYLTIDKSTGDITPKTGADVAVPGDLAVTGDISGTVAARTKRVHVPPQAWVDDASAGPTAGVVGLVPGKSFANDADDIARIALRVPSDWDGASDMGLKLRWANTAATAIANGETVCWALAWRSKADAELYDAGTAGAASVTYTEAEDPGTDKEIHVSTITIDHDDADQPLAAGDLLTLELRRDVSEDDYGAGAVLLDAWVEYQSTSIADE